MIIFVKRTKLQNGIVMKRFFTCLVILFSLFTFSIEMVAQEINFRAYKSSAGVGAKNVPDVYAWGPWIGNNTTIVINMTKDVVVVGDASYTIMEKPKHWVVKKDFKYCNFECATPSFDKANIKLYQYDRGEYRIYVNEEKKAVRYVVKYLDN